ncbi:MAG: hypothetical protein Q9214_007432, partial [Letrouitia sp. 1 TL-2023]
MAPIDIVPQSSFSLRPPETHPGSFHLRACEQVHALNTEQLSELLKAIQAIQTGQTPEVNTLALEHGRNQKTNTRRLRTKLHLAELMVLEREDIIREREHMIKKQEQKIYKTNRELKDLNAKASFIHEQLIRRKVQEKAMRDGIIQKWKKLYTKELHNTKHYKFLFNRLNSNVRCIAANETNLTAI